MGAEGGLVWNLTGYREGTGVRPSHVGEEDPNYLGRMLAWDPLQCRGRGQRRAWSGVGVHAGVTA